MMKRTLIKLTNIKSFRDSYKEEFGNIDQGLYYKYFEIIMKTIKDYIIQGGYLILPFNVGSLFIEKKDRGGLKTDGGKLKQRFVDWRSTYEYRKKKYPNYTREDWKKPENKEKCLIIYNNDHTDGNIYRIRYTKTNIKGNRNIIYYYFKPIIRFSRQLAKYLKQNKKIPNYYEYYKKGGNKFDYGAFERKITAHNQARKREGYRKYLHSLEKNRNKTK